MHARFPLTKLKFVGKTMKFWCLALLVFGLFLDLTGKILQFWLIYRYFSANGKYLNIRRSPALKHKYTEISLLFEL